MSSRQGDACVCVIAKSIEIGNDFFSESHGAELTNKRRGAMDGAKVLGAMAGLLASGGIKVIDLLCPFVRGGKTGLFGGAGVGK
ncbi:MAG: hypothetical protein LCH56_13030, partial [Proteobacteria bacterium]|nr:hypothetical protein [Pseudomonadota bacterium]